MFGDDWEYTPSTLQPVTEMVIQNLTLRPIQMSEDKKLISYFCKFKEHVIKATEI